jgi:hypothetical protein
MIKNHKVIRLPFVPYLLQDIWSIRKDGVDKMAALLTALGQAGRTACARRMTAMPSVSGLSSAKKAATLKGLPVGKSLEP